MDDFILAPAARDDLHEIWDYYASEIGNVDVADRLRDELFTAFAKLARTPGIGHFRSDLAAEPLRFWQVRQYLIIYRSQRRPIEIARVLYVKRDVQALLE
ncbi:MAG TPA: type II toxin-antitoxin system RelE/ParE family toxin [Chthoniobacteraceae bacterium]|jgi:antitoxin ParD1/3/4/toxin ParE1/3/4|nr:type II toxin-antitoxin system RelE/ParE family toxin [Chthoniobacteraceae bacterium]